MCYTSTVSYIYIYIYICQIKVLQHVLPSENLCSSCWFYICLLKCLDEQNYGTIFSKSFMCKQVLAAGYYSYTVICQFTAECLNTKWTILSVTYISNCLRQQCLLIYLCNFKPCMCVPFNFKSMNTLFLCWTKSR